jgi:hypothetical protein
MKHPIRISADHVIDAARIVELAIEDRDHHKVIVAYLDNGIDHILEKLPNTWELTKKQGRLDYWTQVCRSAFTNYDRPKIIER